MPLLTSSGIGKKRKSDENDENSHPPKELKLDCQVDNDRPNVSNLNPLGITYWNVQWRAPQYKKHKTWDGDAIVAITPSAGSGMWCMLYDGEGGIVNKSRLPFLTVKKGDFFRIGDKEYEVDFEITRADFDSGAYFSGNTSARLELPADTASIAVQRPFTRVQTHGVTVPRKSITLQPVNLMKNADSSVHVTEKPKKTPRVGRSYWTINWTKSTKFSKTNKVWQNDGFLFFENDSVTILSETGESLGKSTWTGPEPYAGLECFLSGKEIRLDGPTSPESLPLSKGAQQESLSLHLPPQPPPPSSPRKFLPPTSVLAHSSLKESTARPRHDPEAEGAVVMKAPSKAHGIKYNSQNRPVVPVVVDPLMIRFLRPHQIEGVKFMYECVMGMRRHEGQGCILADEMGMGKTLQTVTLIWTLLKQSPYAGSSSIGKCLVACPVSLVSNWKKEFNKWIGQDRIGVFVGDKDKTQIKQFLNSRIHQVLVIGYERLKSVINDLAYCQPPIGLIVCDEGHRLKSAHSKVNQMFAVLKERRRILLSGTPIQNNLEELHAMADFCNPGLLDDYASFKRLYENPIMKSRTPGCSHKDVQLGNERSAQLLDICNNFVLRRDASILANYLPPKFEYVVFVKPSDLQLSIYAQILGRKSLEGLIEGSMTRSLALINNLTKISNSPLLLRLNEDKVGEDSFSPTGGLQDAIRLLPHGATLDDFSLSGKFTLLANILNQLRKTTEEKCIVVSHYTSALDAIQAFCDKRRYTYLRLDGQVPAGKRQGLVDAFNKSGQRGCFLFLLSAKAGGVGLNLIGASRLILVDSDWNPSHDLQAMARIHRDGQKRPVYIYRLLTTGTMDEKIYQRQVIKIGLSDALMAGQNNNSYSKTDSFTPQELRDLFTVQLRTPCHTHDLLGCACQNGSAQVDDGLDESNEDSESRLNRGWTLASQIKPEQLEQKKRRVELASLGEWVHVDCTTSSARGRIHDEVLSQLITLGTHSELDTGLPNLDELQSDPPLSRAQTLLADFDSQCVLDEEWSGVDMSRIEGGRITYIFEKKSDSSL